MRIKMRIRRFNPEADSKPWWGEYWVDVEESDRVLDALHQVKWYQDGTLTLRRSCAHGICGSDAMVINGRNALACKVLMQDVGDECQVEPLRSMPLIKDLVVDMEPFFAKYRAVLPYLINDNLPAEGERYQSQEARARYDDTTKCILCAACTTSCPSLWANEDYIGPAAIVQAHRFIFDDRDAAADLRLRVLNDVDGVWRCRTVFNCVQACPREIDVTRAIGEVKLALMNGLED